MRRRKKPAKVIQNIFQEVFKLARTITKGLVQWVLRSLMVLGRRRSSRSPQAGFVLPTVVMVSLVAILLTTAILFRSFDRSKNASNYRVNEAVLTAATPALDRARAKLDALFADPRLPRSTPSDTALYDAFVSDQYTFGDETRLKLVNPDVGAPTPTDTVRTAWKYPVDTDNDGLFDSFTLYGIYFRNPPRNNTNATQFARGRRPVEARNLPMNEGSSQICAGATNISSSSVSGSDWFQINGQLKKAFFVYTATVPIDDAYIAAAGLPAAQYKAHTGSKGFSALEMQQDRLRIPLNNNAVWFQDDVEIDRATDFALNGRVHTNGNLLVQGLDNANRVRFYQVSSPASCFYTAENSKIVVAGNVAPGDARSTANGGNVEVHLFQGPAVAGDANAPAGVGNTANGINVNNKTTTAAGGASVAFYPEAFAQRIRVLVDGAMNLHDQNAGTPGGPVTTDTVSNAANRFPKDVRDNFANNFEEATARQDLRSLLETYFRNQTRRVPYAEVPYPNAAQALVIGGAARSSDPTSPDFVFAGTTGELKTPEQWMLIADPTSGSSANYTNLPLDPDGLRATDPELVENNIENNLGDRILVGNNLPFVKKDPEIVKDGANNVSWNTNALYSTATTNGEPRTRESRVENLDDLGDTSRGGYWEQAAAKAGALATEQAAGGLRIVTGAGVYIDSVPKAAGGTGVRGVTPDTDSFLPSPPTVAELTARGITVPAGTTDANIVWPDSMPMWKAEDRNPPLDSVISPGEGRRGDLQMRATAVYHYANGAGYADTNQLPIACVSSYYDPTYKDPAYTSANADAEPNAQSNNGRVYSLTFASDRATVLAGTYGARLRNQAKMIFPNGRLANPTLAQAVTKVDAAQPLNLAENAAIDSTMCALAIDDGTAAPSTAIPAYAIRERTFLDGRQVQALHRLTLDTTVNPPTPVTTPVATVLPNYTGALPVPGDATDPNKLKITDTNAQLKTSYDLPLEQRQPLEIRVTEIDLGALRTQAIGTPTDTSTTSTNNQEYLIPNSGIIYATRDDGLPDSSSANDPSNPTLGELGVSATDYKLDPTRRPNGIRLINGANLARTDFFRLAEKGFIMASNLPVYIQGDFNLHKAPGAGGAERQEFSTLLTTPLPGNFYTRGTNALAPGGNRGLNPNFACRQGQTATCTEGDQWRAASILSDAITLLSGSFKDGFRNQGDYDLRNNAGNTAVETRLNNGFWANSFVTSANWWGNAAGPTPYPRDNTTDPHVGSYLLNAVTPVQRRTNFPVYQMEICRKLLVSECGPSDWRQSHVRTIAPGRTVQVDAGTTAGLPQEIIPVGSTATLATDADPNLNRYPRRVAFNRDTVADPNGYGLITPNIPNPSAPANPTSNNPTATPYGIVGGVGTPPTAIPYAAGAPTPTSAANALWFLTTATANVTNPSPTGALNTAAGPDTDNAGRLYYLPFDPETVSERQLILPGTPQFPNIPALLPNNAFFVDANRLNSPPVITGTGDTDPSDYAVCITGGTASQAYNATSATTPCPTTTSDAIEAARTALASLATTDAVTDVVLGKTLNITETLTATKKVNVYELPTGIIGDPTPAPMTLTLSKGSQSDPIFVFRMQAGITTPMTFGAGSTVTLALDGVNPNNIFWVSNSGMTITDTGTGHRLVGNFLGGGTGTTSPLTIGATARIPAGRFLGFTSAPSSFSGVLTAMTTTNEPLLVPMLQIHSPEGTPAGAPFFGAINEEWLQQAASTRYNAALIMGDTPSRPAAAPTDGETGGGLANFPRFLEAWESSENAVPSDRTVTINGSFIQFQKSYFATAPIQATNPDAIDTSLFYDTNAYLTGNGFITNVPAGTGVYRYPGGAFARLAPFYRAPTRQWGFDVGLLSQLPDLFSQRFSAPPASRPNEFFREVGRDDAWIQTLLCAGQKPTPTATTYDSPAVPATALPPGGCPAIPDASVGG